MLLSEDPWETLIRNISVIQNQSVTQSLLLVIACHGCHVQEGTVSQESSSSYEKCALKTNIC